MNKDNLIKIIYMYLKINKFKLIINLHFIIQEQKQKKIKNISKKHIDKNLLIFFSYSFKSLYM